MKKRLLTFTLTLLMALTLCAAPAHALTLQETYYLETLYPNRPKNAASYPARLIVNVNGSTATLNGTCGMDASLTEEEMLSILKHGLDAVSGYKELEDAAQDKNTVTSLTEKLKFSDEDMKEIMNNLLSLVGWDNIPGMLTPISAPKIDALNGDPFHDYETINGAVKFGDKVGDIVDILAGEGDLLDFLKPDMLPSVQEFLYNGAKVSWEQFQKDQQKYKDIAALYQAKSRLRQYYARVNQLVKDAQSEDGAWAIRIYDQQVIQAKYLPTYDQLVPQIWTADIELVKGDGSMGNVNGAYTGSFSLKMDTDLAEFDSRRHILFAEHMNKSQEQVAAGAIHWSPASLQLNAPSENKVSFAGDGVSVTLTLPPGANRTLFELPLDATALEQTEYVNTCDYVMVIGGESISGVYTITWTEISETDSFYQSDHNVVIDRNGHRVEGTNEDSGPLPTDMRPYIRMTLVVDML